MEHETTEKTQSNVWYSMEQWMQSSTGNSNAVDRQKSIKHRHRPLDIYKRKLEMHAICKTITKKNKRTIKKNNKDT